MSEDRYSEDNFKFATRKGMKGRKDPGARYVKEELDETKGVTDSAAKITKAESAAAMRARGVTIPEIRAVLGYDSDAKVRAAIEYVLADSLDNYDRETLRHVVESRYEMLWRLTWKRASDNSNRDREVATKNAIAVLNRISELHGLDAPKEVRLHTATNAEIEEWVQRISASSTVGELPQEADIIDVDEEDGEDQ